MPPELAEVSHARLRGLLDRCLQLDSTARPTAPEVLRILRAIHQEQESAALASQTQQTEEKTSTSGAAPSASSSAPPPSAVRNSSRF